MAAPEPVPVDPLLRQFLAYDAWATTELLQACAALDDAQLDAHPDPDSEWSVRCTLRHVVEALEGYVGLLTGARREALPERPEPALLAERARRGVAALDAWLAAATPAERDGRFTTSDDYEVTRWVVLLQAVQHGIDHRRQVASFLRKLGVRPPRIDGWRFGEAVGAVVPPEAG